MKAFTTLLAAISELHDALIAMTDEELDSLISVVRYSFPIVSMPHPLLLDAQSLSSSTR